MTKDTVQITAPSSYRAAISSGSKQPNHFRRVFAKVNRNTKCPCGSGSKFKACCKTEIDLFNRLKQISQGQAIGKEMAKTM